jgi:hypothetical protein
MNNNTGYQQTRQFHPFAGLWSGIGDFLSGDQYTPYVNANWTGNGLARSSIGYMRNPNYRDYTSAGQALAAIGSNNSLTKDSGNNRLVNDILGRLSSMGGNLGAWAQKKWNDYSVGKGNTLGDMNVRIWDNQDYNLA